MAGGGHERNHPEIGGLSVAGAVLPAVGFAILLRYLPVKKNFAYLILGFVITAILTTIFGNIQTLGTSVMGLDKTLMANFNSLPMLAIALIGLALAYISYKNNTEKEQAPKAPAESAAVNNNSEGEIEDDEL